MEVPRRIRNLIHASVCGHYKHLLHHISTIEHRGVAKLLLLLLLFIIVTLLLLFIIIAY